MQLRETQQVARRQDLRMFHAPAMVAGRSRYRDGAWGTLDAERAPADARAEARGLVRRAETAARA